MTFKVDHGALDEFLDDLKQNVESMVVCSGYPANYSDATTALGTGSGKKIAQVTGIVPGDLTIGNGPSGGRQVTMAAKTGVSVSVTGTGDHVAWLDDSNTTIKWVTEVNSPQSHTSGNNLNINAHSARAKDPVVAT